VAPSASASPSPHKTQADDDEGNDQSEELEGIICFDFGTTSATSTATVEFGKKGGDRLY
jgi:hypothetical protein